MQVHPLCIFSVDTVSLLEIPNFVLIAQSKFLLLHNSKDFVFILP